MLKVARMQRRQAGADARERSACVVAVGSAQCLLSCSEEEELALVVERLRREDAQHLAVVGSLDLHAVKALPGEVLIGGALGWVEPGHWRSVGEAGGRVALYQQLAHAAPREAHTAHASYEPSAPFA